MKVKKFILVMIVVVSVTSSLMVGCTSSSSNIDKETYTVEEVSKIKKDFSKNMSEAIENSGLRLVEASPDGSFVLSLGNLEYTKNQPKQVLNYSIKKDKKENKEILNIHCVKDFKYDEKLSKDDKFVMAIYNIYKSLTDSNLTEKEFFEEVEKVFNKGEGNVKLPNMGDVIIQVSKGDKSAKILTLRYDDEFVLE